MRGRSHSNKTRTQTNTIDARARPFQKIANSNKQNQRAGARIPKQCELKQTRSMRGRAHSKKSRTQSNNVNAKARVFKETANATKQDQCASARIQKQCEFKETILIRKRSHSNNPRTHANTINARAQATKQRTQANNVNAPARAFNKNANSSKQS